MSSKPMLALMLPAYLWLYLGAEESDFGKRAPLARLLRALLVGVVVSSGLVLLFGAAGVVISAGGSALLGAMPVLRILVGVALVVLGLWMLAGRTLRAGVFGRIATRVGNSKSVNARGFLLFGVAYGLAPLAAHCRYSWPSSVAAIGSRLSPCTIA